MTNAPSAYLAGLLLAGRRVVVVGGGRVAARRVPTLLAAGARVVVVSPALAPGLADLADTGAISWQARGYAAGDLTGAWYVLAATDDPAVNAQVATDAEAQHTFCVRCDQADLGSAWTPATGRVGELTVGIITGHDPRRARRVRDRLVTVVEDEQL